MCACDTVKAFLSTPSARRATLQIEALEQQLEISIHALREEGDREVDRRLQSGHFISIHALREEGDAAHIAKAKIFMYFYPRPPRGGRQAISSRQCIGQSISIHALREEGDQIANDIAVLFGKFLSTPSARRAT